MSTRNVQSLGSGSGRRDGREPGWGWEIPEGDAGRSVDGDIDDTGDDSGGETRQSRPTDVFLNPTQSLGLWEISAARSR